MQSTVSPRVILVQISTCWVTWQPDCQAVELKAFGQEQRTTLE